jgi:hypothetical protein
MCCSVGGVRHAAACWMFGELDSNSVLNRILESTDSASGLTSWRLLIWWNSSCMVACFHFHARNYPELITLMQSHRIWFFFFKLKEMSTHGWASVSDCCTVRLRLCFGFETQRANSMSRHRDTSCQIDFADKVLRIRRWLWRSPR